MSTLERHSGISSRYLSLRGQSERARYFPAHEEDKDSARRAMARLRDIEDYTTRVMDGKVPGR